MQAYLEKVKGLLIIMKEWTFTKIPQAENEEANLLAKMASALPINITRYIPLKLLCKPIIEKIKVLPITMPNKPT